MTGSNTALGGVAQLPFEIGIFLKITKSNKHNQAVYDLQCNPISAFFVCVFFCYFGKWCL